MIVLRTTATQLIADAKSQFETATEFEVRRNARRSAWADENAVLVLPTPVNTGESVYNAEKGLYTVGLDGPLALSPGGWDSAYQTGRGLVGINLTTAFPAFTVRMAAPEARQFYEHSADYELVFIARPAAPFLEQESYRERYSLLATVSCRFVRRKADQAILYFASP